MDVLHGSGQQIVEGLIRKGDASRFGTEGPGDHLHLAQNHVRVVHEVLIHPDAVFVNAQVDPVRLPVDETVAFLQEQNIRGDVRARRTFEGIIGQADRAEQVGTLGNVLTDGGILLVHGALGGHEGNDAAGTHLVQRLGEEIVVDQEVVLVIPLVGHLELTEGDVAHSGVEEAVGQFRGFKTLDGDGGTLVELLRNAA